VKIDTLTIDVEETDDVTLTDRDDDSLQITVTQPYGRTLTVWFPVGQADSIRQQLALEPVTA
jgi:hypothetical protein